jgi:hypothetical protein
MLTESFSDSMSYWAVATAAKAALERNPQLFDLLRNEAAQGHEAIINAGFPGDEWSRLAPSSRAALLATLSDWISSDESLLLPDSDFDLLNETLQAQSDECDSCHYGGGGGGGGGGMVSNVNAAVTVNAGAAVNAAVGVNVVAVAIAAAAVVVVVVGSTTPENEELEQMAGSLRKALSFYS